MNFIFAPFYLIKYLFIKRKEEKTSLYSILKIIESARCPLFIKKKSIILYLKIIKNNYLVDSYLNLLMLNESIKKSKSIFFNENEKFVLFEILFDFKINFENLDDETMITLDILKNINVSLNSTYGISFYKEYLFKRFVFFKKHREVFFKLKSLDFDLGSFFVYKENFIKKEMMNSFTIKEFNNFFKRTPDSFEILSLSQKENLIHELLLLDQNKDSSKEWIVFFINKYFNKKIDFLDKSLYALFFKLNNKFKIKEVENIAKDFIKRERSLLLELMGKNYSFDKITINNFQELNTVEKSSDIKDLVLKTFSRNNKNLIKVFSNNFIKNDVINFNLIQLSLIIREENLDFIYKVLNSIDPTRRLRDDHFLFVKEILSNINCSQKIKFLKEIYQNENLINDVERIYKEIISRDSYFKVNFKFKDLNDLYKKMNLIFKNKYFKNDKLEQIENFNFLEKIDGLVVDDLKFEVPKTTYDLFEYSVKMNNCIFNNYSVKCLIKACILIGVYKSDKLEYNIEIGISYVDNFDLTRYAKNEKNQLRVIQIEKRNKSQMNISDQEKIINLIENNLLLKNN